MPCDAGTDDRSSAGHRAGPGPPGPGVLLLDTAVTASPSVGDSVRRRLALLVSCVSRCCHRRADTGIETRDLPTAPVGPITARTALALDPAAALAPVCPPCFPGSHDISATLATTRSCACRLLRERDAQDVVCHYNIVITRMSTTLRRKSAVVTKTSSVLTGRGSNSAGDGVVMYRLRIHFSPKGLPQVCPAILMPCASLRHVVAPQGPESPA